MILQLKLHIYEKKHLTMGEECEVVRAATIAFMNSYCPLSNNSALADVLEQLGNCQ